MQRKTVRRLATFGIVLAVLCFTWVILVILPRPQNYEGTNSMMKGEGELPVLIAHGGGNREFPDNTLEAFYNAYSVDPRVMMETDVSITKDGVILLSHDTTLDRKTNVTGAIADWNYTDLIAERVDFGYTNPTDEDDRLSGERSRFTTDDGQTRTPLDVTYPEGVTPRDAEIFYATTLEDLLVAFPHNRINVEIKQEGDLGKKALAAVIDLLERYDAFDRVVLASFHSEIYDTFRTMQKNGEVPAQFMYSPGTAGVVKYYILYTLHLDLFFTDRICVFQLPDEQMGLNLAKRGLVHNAHKHNIAVHYWTINDEEMMRHLIEIGADGIMTDYPHRLASVYSSVR